MNTFSHPDTIDRDTIDGVDTVRVDRGDETDLEAAERLLAEAGLSFTKVERCGRPGCEVCEPRRIATAA